MNGNNDQDIHDRYPGQAGSAASTAAGSPTMSNNNNNGKPAESKTTQAVRDAHFQEDGVRADGTLPKAKPADEDEGEE